MAIKQRLSLKDINIALNGKIVGGGEELSIDIKRDNEEAFEAGNYKCIEIVDGKTHVSGSLKRAWIDNDLLNEIFPNQNLQPSFTLTGSIISGKTPGRNIRLFGCKFDGVSITDFNLDGYAKNDLPFKGTDWKFD